MATLEDYRGLDVLAVGVPGPAAGGEAISNNFRHLVDWNPKSDWSATADPSASDDDTQDFQVGSGWLNTTTGHWFVCTDNTTGAAKWKLLPAVIDDSADQTLISAATGAISVVPNGDNGRLHLASSGDISLETDTGSGWVSQVFVDHSSSNIGIGTASPDKKLEVVGTVKSNLEPDGDVDGTFFVGEHDNSTEALKLGARFPTGNHYYSVIEAVGNNDISGTRNRALLLDCDSSKDSSVSSTSTAVSMINCHKGGTTLQNATLFGVYNNDGEQFSIYAGGGIRMAERASDPATPNAGFGAFWVSDGTGTGDAGDFLVMNDAGTIVNLSQGGASSPLTLTASLATEIPLTVVAHASQSVNVTEWKDSGGTVGAHITSNQEFHNSGGGTNSCVFGAGANVDGDEPSCSSFGVGATCYGDGGVAIGHNAAAGSSASTVYRYNVAIGAGATADNSSGVAIGYNADVQGRNGATTIGAYSSVTGNSGTAIGTGASAGAFGVAIGQGTTNPGSGVTIGKDASGLLAIGYGADGSGHVGAVSVGTSSYAAALGSIAFGYNADAGHQGAVSIGYGAVSTASRQLVVGSDSLGGAARVDDVYIGKGVTTASPTDTTFNATGGSGTDIDGANLHLAGGKGTGSASGGDVVFKASTPGSSGTSLQSLAEKARIGHDGMTLVAQSNSPGTPADGSEVVIYLKSSKYVIAYNDSGTVKYRYMDLTSTNADWTYSTTAP